MESRLYCCFSVTPVLYCSIKNFRVVNNDLKFRYIHSNQSIDSTGLQNIETISCKQRQRINKKYLQGDVEYELGAKQELASKNINRNIEPDSSQE